MRLVFIDPGLRKAPFFLELRRFLDPRIECLYYSRRPVVRGYVRSVGAPLFPGPNQTQPPAYEISDAELRVAIGAKELALRGRAVLKKARPLLAELAALFDAQSVDAVLVWNGSNLRGALAAYLARRRGLPVIFAEHGYLPRTTQLDLEGVNFESSVNRLSRTGAASLPPDPALDAALDATIEAYKAGRPMRDMNPTVPVHYRADRRSWLRREVILWAKRRLRHRARALFSTGDVAAPLPERFVLLPFQVRKDSQLILHSPLLGNDMPRLLELVDAAVAAVDPSLRLVVKFHPSEQPKVQLRYRDLAARYPHVQFISKTPIIDLLPHAAAVVTINSTVGFEGLLHEKPVVTLGENFYTVDGLVDRVEQLDDLPAVLARALSQPVDTERRRAFLRYIHARFLSFGGYGDFSEASQRAVAERIGELLAPDRHVPKRMVHPGTVDPIESPLPGPLSAAV